MNKIYFSFLAAVVCFFSVNSLSAQAAKLAMVEEFTQASCGPCAGQNPAFDALLDQNEDKVVVLKYQTSWPGFDQMNLDNPTEVQNRVDYYGVNGVPNGVVDGSLIANDCGAFDGAPACLDQAEIDAAAAVGSAFEIEMTGGILDGILTVSGTITAVMAAEATTPKLRIAMTERTITAEDAPGGNNGETEYNHVMKKFLTAVTGDDLPSTWAMGDTYDFEYTLNTADVTVYQFGMVRVVAFIQDDADKYVHQAATVNPDITVSYNNNAGVVELVNLPTGVCVGENTVSPEVVIVNGGNEALTSADIVYSVNGGAEQTYSYSGNLATLSQETVVLDPITFEATDVNEIAVTITNPNGLEDEFGDDDATVGSVGLAQQAGLAFTVTFNGDCWAEEASWAFVDDQGNVVASKSYTSADSESEVIDEVILDSDGCYRFVYEDSYGDGLQGSQWPSCDIDGSLNVTDAGGVVIFDYDGSYDTGEETEAFGAVVSSVQELTSLDALMLAPNPVSTELNVTFSLEETTELNVSVLNAVGQVINSNNASYAAGANFLNINTGDFANGMYFLQIRGEEGVKTAKFTVAK